MGIGIILGIAFNDNTVAYKSTGKITPSDGIEHFYIKK